MGQFFHALRPSSLRSRRDSTWSIHTPDSSHPPAPVSDQDSQSSLPTPRPPSSAPPVPSVARAQGKRLPQVRSVESFRQSSSSELSRIQSLDPAVTPGGRVPFRHANTISPVMPVGESPSATLVPSSPVAPDSPVDMSAPSHPSASPSAPVFRRLLPFLYRDQGATQLADQSSAGSGVLPPPPEPPLPRRGDIVCLKYDTLDDRSMHRLEGRSDHRPVIGTYAVYI